MGPLSDAVWMRGSWTARGSSRLGSEAQVILQIIMSGAEHRYHDVFTNNHDLNRSFILECNVSYNVYWTTK